MRRSSSEPGRARGIKVAWAVAGAIALSCGAIYATGFAATSGTAIDPSQGEATPLLGAPAAPEFPLYPNAITTTNLAIGFNGLDGVLAHDTNVFTIHIPAIDPRTGFLYPGGTTFVLNVIATNQTDLVSGAGGHTPWSDLTLDWTIAPCPGGIFSDETAATPTFATPTEQQVMAVTSGTNQVALSGLAPETVYCAGLRQYPNTVSPDATSITRPYATDADATAANPAWTSATPVTPLFTALLQRTS
jgi:hypothetical protein